MGNASQIVSFHKIQYFFMGTMNIMLKYYKMRIIFIYKSEM